MTVKWIGNDLLVAPKYKEGNIEAMHVLPYTLDRKTLKIEQWPGEKQLKGIRRSEILISSDNVHFILACLDGKLKIL
jgi:hypothetical protein